jgi:hypothetical protein
MGLLHGIACITQGGLAKARRPWAVFRSPFRAGVLQSELTKESGILAIACRASGIMNLPKSILNRVPFMPVIFYSLEEASGFDIEVLVGQGHGKHLGGFIDGEDAAGAEGFEEVAAFAEVVS